MDSSEMDRSQKVILTCMCMIEKNNQILVQDKVSQNYKGITFPGGHVEEGESLTDAVIREVWEETGLTITNPNMGGVYNWITENGIQYIIFLYKASSFSGELYNSDEGEVFWIEKDQFFCQNLAHGMEKVYDLINNDLKSEYFHG